jgi:hypothetical protein
VFGPRRREGGLLRGIGLLGHRRVALRAPSGIAAAAAKAGYAFTIGLLSMLNLVKKAIDEVEEAMREPKGYGTSKAK